MVTCRYPVWWERDPEGVIDLFAIIIVVLYSHRDNALMFVYNHILFAHLQHRYPL
jgi:hypothetical protein